MKRWKFCVNAGFFGRRRDRFTEYQPDRSLEEKLRLISQVNGIKGVELKYPFDLQDVQFTKKLLEDRGLVCSAVNVDIKDAAYFRHGALSASNKDARNRAIEMLKQAMDIAAELGANLVSTCPLADGYDYPFQIDYGDAWGYFIDSVIQVVSYREDVKLALEYQPHEPHSKILLGDVGKMLHICAEVEKPNLGANLDIGHSFAALETPAESATLLASKDRLFYIHTNDNTGDGGDWDMISGSVHFWHWMELLLVLDKIGYEGWLGADIAPKTIGPVEAFDINIRMIQRMLKAIEQMGSDKILELVRKEGNIDETYDFLSRLLVRED
ncbi:MAG: sugar phosphate isomerase/epimerase [Deltaproteobacteria bacterium]|nr:sugar phosphate isomerase/epimerase [Deltaproteobacteria bacterium]MBW1993832.1 sugar phosphate isomerase/epimerase [Deltaproteobacteria bacterium]MBW2152631.1 sugar phosphate isomerase/epimerase [Deltaproteobacteria bacterium]